MNRRTWYGRHWYWRLIEEKDGLLAHHTYEPGRHLIICSDIQQQRMFTLFADLISYVQFIERIPKSLRCFYEVVPGTCAQKAHFDIDMKPDLPAEETVEHFMAALVSVMNELVGEANFDLARDVVMCTSHGAEKLSYHIILPNHYHNNHQEAKLFHSMITSKMDLTKASYIDSAVYSSMQQFRMLGCHKYGSDRTKIIAKKWRATDRDICFTPQGGTKFDRRLHKLHTTLLSFIAPNAQHIPIVVPEPPRGDKLATPNTYCDIHGALQHNDPEGAFTLGETVGNIVRLMRVAPSYCPLCERAHEHENPYLLLNDCNGKVGIFYHCRRAPKLRLRHWGYLGHFQQESNVAEKVRKIILLN